MHRASDRLKDEYSIANDINEVSTVSEHEITAGNLMHINQALMHQKKLEQVGQAPIEAHSMRLFSSDQQMKWNQQVI